MRLPYKTNRGQAAIRKLNDLAYLQLLRHNADLIEYATP